jgi:hypothetical protein
MPVYIDTQAPTSLDRIAAAIAPYDNQRAAEMDFDRAPQGRDYLIDQYRRLTGEMNANPFDDAFKMKNEIASQAVRTGTGNPVSSSIATLQNLGDREVARQGVRDAASVQGRMYALSDPNLSTEKRANYLGVGTLFGQMTSRNPELRNLSGPNIDPRLGVDKGGKIYGQEALHSIYYQPEFQEILNRDPEQAHKIYAAYAGNNRSLSQDLQIQSQHLMEQKNERRKVLENIKGIKQNADGSWTKTIQTKDPLSGAVTEQQLPLTDFEKSAISKENGIQGVYGFSAPSDVRHLEDATPEQNKALSALILRYRQQGKSPEDAIHDFQQAGQMKHSKQQKSANSVGLMDAMMGVFQGVDIPEPSLRERLVK